MTYPRTQDLAHNLILPTLFFAALGAMTWAVRGCSGFGAVNGCIFAGVTWGTAWWIIAQEPSGRQPRPYSSAWIILALTVGIGFSGNRGWMQWPSFFAGHLQTDTATGQFVPIPRIYGFVWLFIAGVPWAGLGACLLAWCGSHRPARAVDWAMRIASGIGMAILARTLFENFPDVFLPLHKTLTQYSDLHANPNLRRLINDNRAAMTHLGLYLGFLTAEALRRDWRNVLLILTVGLLNGLGWSACQNWHWAAGLWPNVKFNWWRCWESSGGISIGIAYGVAYYLVNRPMPEPGETAPAGAAWATLNPNWQRLGAYAGVLLGLGLSIRNGLKGWANIYLGNEAYWNRLLWRITGPALIAGVVGLIVWTWVRPVSKSAPLSGVSRPYLLAWLVLITQNLIAQLVTGPWTAWSEVVFSLYYLLLFLLSGVILYHYQEIHRQAAAEDATPQLGRVRSSAPPPGTL